MQEGSSSLAVDRQGRCRVKGRGASEGTELLSAECTSSRIPEVHSKEEQEGIHFSRV